MKLTIDIPDKPIAMDLEDVYTTLRHAIDTRRCVLETGDPTLSAFDAVTGNRADAVKALTPDAMVEILHGRAIIEAVGIAWRTP